MKPSQFAIVIAVAALAVAAPAASAEQVDKPEVAVEKTDTAVETAPQEAAADKPAEEKAGAQTPAPTAGCDARVFSRVFKPWHDRALYTLAPGGDFETQAEGWTLAGPAAIAADSAPFLLGAALGAGSLELPAGPTAVSPPICVERGFPSFRFVARSVSADPGVLSMQVLYAGDKRKKAGRVKPAAEWAPTRKVSLAQGRFRIRRGGSALVQLRFAAIAGTVRVNDVYVDPRYNR